MTLWMIMLEPGIFGRLQSLVCGPLLSIKSFFDRSVVLGSSLASQFMKAIKMRAKHVALFDRFSKRFSPATIETWTAMIISWEGDTSKPCPYEEPSNGESYAIKVNTF